MTMGAGSRMTGVVFAALLTGAFALRDAQAASVPAGFRVSVLAHVPGAREMAPCGNTLYAGTAGSAVFAVALDSGRVTRVPGSFTAPNGVACAGNRLYVAERTRISAFPLSPEGTVAGPATTVRGGLPDLAHHGLRYIAVGPDGRVYVSIGSPCNICRPQGLEGRIVSMNADGSGLSTVATGIRNSVGFDWDASGTLFFTDNQADGMGDNIPPDLVNEVRQPGAFYGFPYVQGQVRLKGFENAEPPQSPVPPVYELQAHVAPLGIHFYRGSMLGLRGDAFIAEHGSWNRTVPVGYQVVLLDFEGGRPTSLEPFARGVGRPVDVKELADGALVISTDAGSTIYRVTR
jgi:glucose/arabinose dehydrogenase